MEVLTWAESVGVETRSIWERKLKGKYSGWENGFEIFYSPIIANPLVMFVGTNPGGSAKDFDVQLAGSIPGVHAYSSATWPLAVQMRRLLANCDPALLFERSVKTNLNFFRSPTQETLLPDAPESLRRELGDFCKRKVLEAIDILKPEIIVAESLGTFDALAEPLFGSAGSTIKGKRETRIYCKVERLGLPRMMLGIVLPTGQGATRVVEEDWQQVAKCFARDIRPKRSA